MLVLAYCVFYVVSSYQTLKKLQEDPIFQQVIEQLNHNQVAMDILGNPIKPELLFFNSKTEGRRDSQAHQIDFVIPIYGPRQTATVFVRLVLEGDSWHYASLLMQVDGQETDLDLLLLNEASTQE